MDARLYPFWASLTEGLKTGRPQNPQNEIKDEYRWGGDLNG